MKYLVMSGIIGGALDYTTVSVGSEQIMNEKTVSIRYEPFRDTLSFLEKESRCRKEHATSTILLSCGMYVHKNDLGDANAVKRSLLAGLVLADNENIVQSDVYKQLIAESSIPDNEKLKYSIVSDGVAEEVFNELNNVKGGTLVLDEHVGADALRMLESYNTISKKEIVVSVAIATGVFSVVNKIVPPCRGFSGHIGYLLASTESDRLQGTRNGALTVDDAASGDTESLFEVFRGVPGYEYLGKPTEG